MNTQNTQSFRIPERPERTQVLSAQAEPRTLTNFPRLMRVLGALALVASGVAFLFEGWHSLTSFGKFGAFTGFLLALGAAGAFCARVIGENKGARCFLSLAAAGVTVQAAQLGALAYELVNPVGATKGLTSFVLYEAAGLASLAGMVAVFMLLLMPVAGLGFAALARTQARFAAGLFLALCSFLLVPTRVDLHVLALGGLGIAALLWAERNVFRGDATMATTEGWIMRGILAAPVATIFGREVFYPVSAAASGIFALGAGTGFFLLARHSLVRKAIALPAQAISFGLVGLGWLQLAHAIGVSTMLFWLPVSWSAIGLSFQSVGGGRNYRALGAIGSLAACVTGLHGEAAWMLGLNLSLNGVLLVALAFSVKELSVLRSGVIAFAAGLAWVLWAAASAYDWNSWIGLAVVGAAALLTSSYIERNRERLVGAYSSFRQRTHTWS